MQEQIKTQCTQNVFEVIYIALKKDRKFLISPKQNKEGILKEVKFEAKIQEYIYIYRFMSQINMFWQVVQREEYSGWRKKNSEYTWH